MHREFLIGRFQLLSTITPQVAPNGISKEKRLSGRDHTRRCKSPETHDSHTAMQRIPPALVYRGTATSAVVWKFSDTTADGAVAAAAVPMNESDV